jgi:hypothetical protein
MMARIWRLALDFKVDLRYWRIETLSAEQQTRDRCKPRPYILKALEILGAIGGGTIVEIGTLRQAMTAPCLAPPAAPFDAFTAPACCNDGHSTYFWARSGLEVHSVDVDPRCRDEVAQSYENLGEPWPSNLQLHVPADGIEFLAGFRGTIGLLYLDGWDKGTPDYARRHLEAFVAARPRLAPLHLVAIDDTDFDTAEGGKDALLTPVLLERGYLPLLRGRQTLFLGGAGG